VQENSLYSSMAWPTSTTTRNGGTPRPRGGRGRTARPALGLEHGHVPALGAAHGGSLAECERLGREQVETCCLSLPCLAPTRSSPACTVYPAGAGQPGTVPEGDGTLEYVGVVAVIGRVGSGGDVKYVAQFGEEELVVARSAAPDASSVGESRRRRRLWQVFLA